VSNCLRIAIFHNFLFRRIFLNGKSTAFSEEFSDASIRKVATGVRLEGRSPIDLFLADRLGVSSQGDR